ncbi:MAG: hypothetical protein R2809_03350 [Flavobacteriales bacterium]
MVKKIIFFSVGVMAALAMSGYIKYNNSEEAPVLAKKGIDWDRTKQSSLIPNVSDAAANEITWKMLSDVTFKQVYVTELDSYFWKPTFGPAVKAYEGKEVYITGYVIPVDYDDNFYVVSRYPYANCYFCGGGGPESVADLRFTGKHRAYKTDERLTFKGKLKLNADDIYQMNYILEGAMEYVP